MSERGLFDSKSIETKRDSRNLFLHGIHMLVTALKNEIVLGGGGIMNHKQYSFGINKRRNCREKFKVDNNVMIKYRVLLYPKAERAIRVQLNMPLYYASCT